MWIKIFPYISLAKIFIFYKYMANISKLVKRLIQIES